MAKGGFIKARDITTNAVQERHLGASQVTTTKVDKTGAWDFSGASSFSVPAPSSDSHASTKKYVDDEIAAATTGLAPKAPVRFASTGALAAYTRVANVITENGAGVGLGTIDGVVVVTGDRMLLKDGAAGKDNGIYDVTEAGGVGTPFVLTRSSDADTSAEVVAGINFMVTEGTLYADRGFALTTNDPIVLNTTALTFTEVIGVIAASAPGASDSDTASITVGGSTDSDTASITVGGSTDSDTASITVGGSTDSDTASITVGGNADSGTASITVGGNADSGTASITVGGNADNNTTGISTVADGTGATGNGGSHSVLQSESIWLPGTWGVDLGGLKGGLIGQEPKPPVAVAATQCFAYKAVGSEWNQLSNTAASGSYTANFQVFPDSPANGDIVYFGFDQPEAAIQFLVSGTVGIYTGDACAIEYSQSGPAWATPTYYSDVTDTTVPDGKRPFQQGACLMVAPPSDWAAVDVNGVTKYWIRYRVTDATKIGTVAVLADEPSPVRGEDPWAPMVDSTLKKATIVDGAGTLHTAKDVVFCLFNEQNGESRTFVFQMDKRRESFSPTSWSLASSTAKVNFLMIKEDETNEPTDVLLNLRLQQDVADHTHTGPSHTHNLTDTGHTHNLTSATATDAGHTHNLTSATATDAGHTHNLTSATATDAGHTHGSSALTATDAGHTHGSSALTATDAGHTHNLTSATATDAGHTHAHTATHTHALG